MSTALCSYHERHRVFIALTEHERTNDPSKISRGKTKIQGVLAFNQIMLSESKTQNFFLLVSHRAWFAKECQFPVVIECAPGIG